MAIFGDPRECMQKISELLVSVRALTDSVTGLRNDFFEFRSEMRAERVAAQPSSSGVKKVFIRRPLVRQLKKISSDQQLAEFEEKLVAAGPEDIEFQNELVRKGKEITDVLLQTPPNRSVSL